MYYTRIFLEKLTKTTQKKTCQDLQSPTQDSTQVPHKHKSRVLPLQPPTLYRVKNSVEMGEMSHKIWWDVCICGMAIPNWTRKITEGYNLTQTCSFIIK